MGTHRDGLAVVNSDHRIAWVNDVFARIIGCAPNDLIGRKFEEITHPDDVNLDAHLAVRLFAGDLVRYTMEKRYIRKDGSHVRINLRASGIKDASGKVGSALAVITEIEPAAPNPLDESRHPEDEVDAIIERIRRVILD